ncbi:methionine synthase reductase mitochondrial precursor-like protein [Leptomonas pyrrhocoris]|uniref:NADPH--hemoprotein reductase n=1 Tax=Leptomonas pyrrhocoris TaxID=157538 RepID=A0A0M9G3L0_LEPPY|nr:methionine synthase reductase mitochondrial precursor-like protein [Leptomonas pyrrhocoris]KPA81537.1 methionine synthase reductase mitochondrial precursor-like protein [Leptomonas pyrrhocoris]|eukprot:XP_015659976.1 methionine synthase reductase mitochondrial precursor-like protein [Leptomonas pyrrhocoris]
MSGESSQPSNGERLFFLYGSETGNAESIAKRLHHDAVNTHGFTQAACMSLNQFVAKKVLDEHLADDVAVPLCLVVVCSTTGEGEPPLNASRFRRWLRNTSGTLHKVRYCVLAIGDTNYNSFCAPGISVDNKLNEMGAVRCYPRGEADDGVGLELVVDPWTENVWSALKKGNSSTGETEAVGREKYQAAEPRVDMSVAQEAAILYSNASQLCSVAALFLYERVVELGGKADLYPIQYFHPRTSLVRPPKVLLFIVATDADEGVLCEKCACQPQQLPPLGPFSTWLSSSSGSDSSVVPADAAEVQGWMADPSIRFFNSLVIAPKKESAGRAQQLDANLKTAATLSKLEFLCRRQSSGEVPSVAVTDDDAFFWVEGVLDSLPGVTATADTIHSTMEYFFDDRVGAEFRRGVVSGDVGYTQKDGSASEQESAATTTTTTGTRRRYRLHERDEGRSSTTDGAGSSHSPQPVLSPPPQQQQERAQDGTLRKTHQVLDDLLTPVVFLYSDKSKYVKQCALDVFGAAGQHHLRSSVCELSNFRQTGFPRRATFVFVVSGVLTKSMVRVLKVLRTMQAQGKQVDGVHFAILGIDKSTESDKFNACALELETLLLEMKATKIHCTGLADMDCGSLLPIIQSWESNLWSAIVHPMKSVAYLDMASPNIQVHQTFSPLTGVPPGMSGAAAAAIAGAGAGDSDGNGVPRGAESTLYPVAGTVLNSFSLPTADSITAELARKAPSTASPIAAAVDALPGSSGVRGANSVLLSSGEGTAKVPMTATGGLAIDLGSSLFPWDIVPLHKANAQRTPVAFLYASAGMSKTMALNAMQTAAEKRFPAVLHSFANYQLIDFRAYPNLILFCEAGPDGQSSGGRRFKKFLTHPLHRPDDLSYVRFAVLGLGATPSNVVHPAFLWAKLLSRLQANRVFPVVIMPSMSQLHSLGIPWAECVLASMALIPTTTAQPADATREGLAPAPDGNHPPDEQQRQQQQHRASPSTAPHDSENDSVAAVTINPQRSILFLFGSSTGITESIARDLHREALERGFHSRIAALQYFQKMSFLSTANVVLVCSTIPTAPGGFPRNARSFARYVLAQDQPVTLLSGTSFAVLGVGNGSATLQGPTSYCRTAVRFDRRMAELGGHRLCEVGTVDASQAIAQPVEEWRQAMFAALEARAAAQQAVEAEEEQDEAQYRELPLPLPSSANNGSGGGGVCAAALEKLGGLKAESAANSSVVAVADRSRLRPQRAMIAYCCTPTSVVEELAEHLVRVIEESTPMVPTVCTMNDLLKRNWRSEFEMLIFVAGQNSEAEYPMNGATFARVLRQRTAPLDMFAYVSYTVLAVSDSNSTQFFMGRQLDRRLEELGGTRVYARGEVVDSFRLERTVEKWLAGLTNLLTSMCENAVSNSDLDEADEVEGGGGVDGGVQRTATAAAAKGKVPSEVNAGKLLRSLHRTNDVAVMQREKRTSKGRSTAAAVVGVQGGTGETSSDGMEPTAATSRADCDRVKANNGREDGGEDPQNRFSSEADAESRVSGVASSSQDWRTESSMVNRIAYSANNAGDRVDGVVQSWKLLTSPQAERPVLQLNLSVSAETQWSPGQTVAILPSNNSTEVEALLQLFKVPHHEPFHPLSMTGTEASCFPTSPLYDAVDFPVSCGTILLRYVDLRVTRSHKPFIQLLEKSAPNELDRAAVQQYFQAFSSERTPRALLEVLEAFPHCIPPFRHVVENLTLMQPRQYSICSSHQADATTLSICFKFVEKGLCTGWMCEQCLWASKLPAFALARLCCTKNDGNACGQRRDIITCELVQPNTLIAAKRRVLIPFVVRRASEFRLPRDPLIPMVLIGPGTGIAPFRAFLQEREAWLTQRQQQCGSTCLKGQLCGCPYAEASHTSHAICGSIDLFDGCHRRGEDFLFGDELRQWEEDGVLHSMTVAFSREPNEGGFWYGGCYVQDKMRECAVALMDLILQRNAHLFVCGDADGMAKEVHATLLELIQQHLSLSDAAAAEYLEQLSKDGRYLRDVWSTSF